jgi:predicted flap endonuclease-1-like 5' DNA nuclease
MSKLTTIEGIGEVYEAKFVEVGIKSVEALLEAGATKKGRIDLAEKSGISEKLVLKFVNHADLFRIKGIAGEYAELLEAAGVDTVVELAGRRPDNLTAKLAEVNEEKKLVRRVPVLKEVEKWVAQAKELPRAVFY